MQLRDLNLNSSLPAVESAPPDNLATRSQSSESVLVVVLAPDHLFPQNYPPNTMLAPALEGWELKAPLLGRTELLLLDSPPKVLQAPLGHSPLDWIALGYWKAEEGL